MKREKGFTLIEVIAVIVILGLIVLIAIPFFQGSLTTFRDDYYDNLETSVTNSAKEFFKDNKLYLPNRYLDTQKIDLNALNEGKYLKDVRDYNGQVCDSVGSYTIAVKVGSEEYEYATCMNCPNDEYESVENIYCSEAWDNDKGFTEVVFDNPPDVYVYRGTSREKLKELVVVYPDIRRCLGVDSCTKEVKRVSAKGSAGVQPIYPENIDFIDTSKVGTYDVTYVYDLHDKDSSGKAKKRTGKVIVYEFKPTDPIFTEYNTVYDTTATGNTVYTKKTKVVEKAYNPNNNDDWAQKLNIRFDYDNIVNGEKVLIARYQWLLNGRWEDFCVPDRTVNAQSNECSRTLGNVTGGFELNDDMKFRFIDTKGRISEEKTYKLRIDYSAPDKCSIKAEGSMGDNEWFKSDKVTVIFSSKDDKAGTSGNSGGSTKSGIAFYGISTGARVQNEKGEQTADTNSVTWYGYVEDKAGNFTVCSRTFKKDSTPPTCTAKGDNTTWKNTAVTISWGCQDSTSGCYTQDSSKTFNENNSFTKTWTAASYDIYDNAGNKKTCESKSRNIYYDKKAPECSHRGDSTSYTKDNRKIYYGCLDSSETGQSGCNTAEQYKEFSSTTVTGTIAAYTIKDAAGNSTSCASRTANVYVDKTAPTCTVTKSNTGTVDGLTTTVTCSDGNSGCKTTNTTGEANLKTSKTYKVYDNVGNEGSCNVVVVAQSQKRTKSCSSGKRCSSASCETYKQCANSACGVASYKSCANEACGVASYKACEAAGCKTYKSCANSACGVAAYNTCAAAGCAAYNSCANSACGVASYNSCANSACGVAAYNTCANSACGTTSETYCSGEEITLSNGTTGCYEDHTVMGNGASCTSRGWGCTRGTTTHCYNGNISAITQRGCKPSSSPNHCDCRTHIGYSTRTVNKTCATAACGVAAYNTCATAACGVASYNTCATAACGCAAYNAGSACGVAAYNTCANAACGCAEYNTGSVCGVASYKTCATAACGVESYKSCRTSACGCETYSRDIGKCGCETWGNFGSWSNVNSCSAGESSNHSTTTECRVVYN